MKTKLFSNPALLHKIERMARRKRNSGIETVNLRVDVDIRRAVESIASMKGVSAPGWVSDFLRPLLKKELEKAFKDMTQSKPAE